MDIQLTQYCSTKDCHFSNELHQHFSYKSYDTICVSLFPTSLFCSLFYLFLFPPMLDNLNYCSLIVSLGLICISICILNLSTEHLILECPKYFSPCSFSVFELNSVNLVTLNTTYLPVTSSFKFKSFPPDQYIQLSTGHFELDILIKLKS